MYTLLEGLSRGEDGGEEIESDNATFNQLLAYMIPITTSVAIVTAPSIKLDFFLLWKSLKRTESFIT